LGLTKSVAGDVGAERQRGQREDVADYLTLYLARAIT
jgi:hypothetical protein